MAIRGVLFDKDGTLIAFDGFFGLTYLKMLQEHFGHSADEALAMLVGTGFVPETGRCRGGTPMASDSLRQIVREWWPNLPEETRRERARIIDVNFDRDAHRGPTPILALEPVFEVLKNDGYLLGVATNDIEASALSHMEQIGIREHFAVLIGADSVAEPKPSGNMIARFAEVTGLAPNEIAMVGDNAHDMNEARAGRAGLAIGVLSGNSTHDELAHLADHVIASVAELPQLLKDLRNVL